MNIRYLSCLILALLLSVSPCQAQMLQPGLVSPTSDLHPNLVWGEREVGYIDKWGTRLRVYESEKSGWKEKIIPTSEEGQLRAVGFDGKHATVLRWKGEHLFFEISDLNSSVPTQRTEIELFPATNGAFRALPEVLCTTTDPDRFFGYAVYVCFSDGSQASVASWWRKTGPTRLEMEELFPIDFEGAPLHLPWTTPGGVRLGVPNLGLKGLFPLMDHPIRVPGGFAVVSWRAGIVWLFRDGDLSVRRTVQLVSLDSDFIKGKTPLRPVVLGAQPTKAGKLLVAHRPAALHEDTQESPEGDVVIRWTLVDPETGETGEAPEEIVGGAPRTWPSREIRGFSFGFSPTGRLVVPWTRTPERKNNSRNPDATIAAAEPTR